MKEQRGNASMMSSKSAVSVLVMALLLGACGGRSYFAKVEGIHGAIDKETIEMRAKHLKKEDVSDVKVFEITPQSRPPEGVKISGGSISVDPASKIKIIAKVHTDSTEDYTLLMRYLFWYVYPADDDWKNTYCTAQVGLKWLTIGAWMFLPPFWPCIPSEGEREWYIISDLKKVTKAAGGNAVVITTLGSIRPGGRGGAEGYALKLP